MFKTSYLFILTGLLFAGVLCHTQVITTIAGTGVSAYSSDGGLATASTALSFYA